MKTTTCSNASKAGYALIYVMAVTVVALLVLGATLSRTVNNAKLNSRSVELAVAQNAAEAAVEKVYARMAYDFHRGYSVVVANKTAYTQMIPDGVLEDPYWANFTFSDGQNHNNSTYVANINSNYSGFLPSQYPGLTTSNAPVWRIVSNAKRNGGTVTGAVQVDVLLALVPLTQYAIFYNSLLEFSTCATMTNNGRVHANGPIYTGSSAQLIFNGSVTTTSTLTSPAWGGQGSNPAWAYLGTFNGGLTTNVPSVTLAIGSTNVHSIIELPPSGESATSAAGASRLYNEAQAVLLVSNSSVTLRIQAAPDSTSPPGADTTPTNIFVSFNATNTNPTNFGNLNTNFPFLCITNTFTDQREGMVVKATQIDVGKYATWLNSSGAVLAKYPVASGNHPTILYVADNRTTNSSQMVGVRLTNGVAPPVNGGEGFSVATPDPLYVLGNYNCTNSAYLGTTNTSATVPCAFMSDALTVLSQNWKDNASGSNYTTRQAVSTTINAAILTGNVPSTGSGSTTFSGGVHNLPRLLEDWNTPSTKQLTLNTSLINLFVSSNATHQFQMPGGYYDPPTRTFSFDVNFQNPARQPPGIPCALVPLRFGWFTPPPNCVTNNVTP
jgi:hypothetical protein